MTAAVSGVLEITLTSAADLGVSVRSVCSDIISERGCVNAAGEGLGTVETLMVPVTAGELVYVIVDGTFPGTGGPYDLEVLSRATVCGDGIREGLEACDDGNTTAGDGCSATCTLEGDVCDAPTTINLPSTTTGDTSTGTDFTSTSCDGANGAAPELLYTFTPAADGLVRIDLTSMVDLGFELRASCDDPSSVLTCRDALVDGTETATVLLTGGQAYDLVVSGYNGASGAFTLDLTPIIEECGNGTLEGMEQCDDGNTTSGDGCSATCVAESSSCATPIDVATLPATLGGSTAAGTNEIELECGLFGLPEVVYEVTPTIDGVLDVTFDSDGLNLAIQTTCGDNDANLFCGGGPIGTATTVPVAAGDPVYFIVNGPTAATYSLEISERAPGCGDGVVDPPESCDDNNTTNGDGCSSTCAIECAGLSESEPNGTSATADGPVTLGVLNCASITPSGDDDFWSFTIAGQAQVVIETFDGNGQQACTNAQDTHIFLFDTDGVTQIASNDDIGPGDRCSRITVPALAAGTYTVRVIEFGDNAAIPGYRIRVNASICGNATVEPGEECDGGAGCNPDCTRVPACGDGFIDAPETCDDGNLIAGDGCSSTCALEVTETESNDTVATADLYTPNFTGLIEPAFDVDFIAVVVPGPASTLTATLVDGLDLCGPPAGGIDSDLQLLAPDGVTQLQFNDDISGATDWCSSVTASGLAAGTYYLRVRSSAQFDADGTFGYGLDVTVN